MNVHEPRRPLRQDRPVPGEEGFVRRGNNPPHVTHDEQGHNAQRDPGKTVLLFPHHIVVVAAAAAGLVVGAGGFLVWKEERKK